ncbi:glycosyltransferase family 4 protein [Polaribacter gangjinensis]|uniref:Glycosyltransferase family 1 protein n=1 Tax=Polaribacter gangjinensis TaxID=574710 RepID=A0A2S7W849_9FLAO|nr:glycosyltransferase family 4 protein [Polaribacter gangjinensis]PQJ73804.1 hypothetical protein BTO13_00270 [Polaribacter gangjinensis]
MKIVFSSNLAWSIYNFRLPLLKSLQNDGHIIYAVANNDKYVSNLENENFIFENININNNSKNPIKDIFLIYKYYILYKKIKPDIICHNAIKPNIYGTLAAKFLNIPVVNNISGLGTLFIKKSFSTRIAKLLYKFSQKNADKIFFQNRDDLNEFIKNKLINEKKCEVISGSGVDTKKFIPKKKVNNLKFKFIFIGRLIFDKGILEFIEALKILNLEYKNFEGLILGPIYKLNHTAVSEKVLNEWINDGIVKYLGETENVLPYIQDADCLVLPSYREGLSKVLIEASSVAIPIITTDVPGCRDVVVDGVTGLLCKVKDSKSLAEKMKLLLNMNVEKRLEMGIEARKRAIDVFDQNIIIDKYKRAIYEIVSI